MIGFGVILLMLQKSCITSRTLNYGNYGIFLAMGSAGFISSTVGLFEVWDEGAAAHGGAGVFKRGAC